MNYKLLLSLICLLLYSCAENTLNKTTKNNFIINKFSNSGFALIYSDNLFKNKIVDKKINQRDLIIFQKNLRRGTDVKIFNPENKKTIIAKVGKNSIYPSFNNSVISKRISDELELNMDEPYIVIEEIRSNSTFIAKKSKMFEIEKKVAGKAPVESISINDLNASNKKKNNNKKKRKFNYSIKIADFYFKKTAESMLNRVKSETSIKKVEIIKISEKNFRVYLGPYSNLKALQKAYNGVEKLGFENIIILKND